MIAAVASKQRVIVDTATARAHRAGVREGQQKLALAWLGGGLIGFTLGVALGALIIWSI